LTRLKTEEIINQIVGNANALRYKDWNADGKMDNPADGFGLLQNGDPGYTDQGYIAQTVSHANFAAQAADATKDIKSNRDSLVICAQNMTGWSEQLLQKAMQLNEMPFGTEMKPLIQEMVSLSDNILFGVDSNGNGVSGECGANTAYEYAYRMAEMPLLPGAHRVPLPATEGNE
jgi:hypothetical protein